MKSDNGHSAGDKSLKVFLILLVGGIFALIGGAALVGHLMGKSKEEIDAEESPAGSLSHVVSDGPFKCKSNSYPLQYGTCHPDVQILQKYLRKFGAALGQTGQGKDGIDGRFGRKTQAASKQYLNKEVFSIQDVQNIRKKLQV